MPPKEELSEELNEILGTDVDFSRMYKEDLEQLHKLADEGHLVEPMLKHIGKKHGKNKLEEVVDDWYPAKYLMRMI